MDKETEQLWLGGHICVGVRGDDSTRPTFLTHFILKEKKKECAYE